MTRSIENTNFSVAFPSSSNTQDRTSVYSVQSSISTNSNDSQPPPPALPYLPFRRISLPSLPPSQSIQHSPLRRQITQPLQPQRSSIASFESVPATGERESRESSSMARNHLVLKNRDSTVFSNSNSNSPNVTPRKGQRRTAVSMQTGSKPPLMSPMRRKSQGLVALPLDDPLLMKRRKVMLEFYETEKTYVEGLDLIYEHFLLPMLNSLETSSPILERPLLTTVFSNFIDIWNFHRSFFNELTRLFCGLEQRLADSPFPNAHSNQTQVLPDIPVFPSFPPPLSPLLLTHFPYLSLYTPFIAAFSQTLAALNTLLTPSHYYRQQSRAQTRTAVARAQSSMPSSLASPSRGTELRYNKRFADFVATQETHPRCGKLQLRDWLLTIVQRCPRYLLLLGDLLSCTPGEAQLPSEDGKEVSQEKKEKDKKRWHREATKEEEKEREKLIQVYGLVSKITNSLNTSIWSHSQTLVLLALQRSTPNLPLDEFQFIYPGRTLLKRGTLLQIENPDARVKRGESKDGDMRPREREFLLFSDCLVWLASEETEKKEKEWNFDLGSIWSSFSGGNGNGTPVKNADVGRPKSAALPTPTPLIVEEEIDINGQPSDHNSSDNKNRIDPVIAVPRNLNRPPMVRTRSKSEAEITTLQAKAAIASTSQANLPTSNLPAQSQTAFPNVHRPTHKSNFARVNKTSALHLHFRDRRGRKDSTSSPRSAGYGGMDHEQWLYKGRIELVNLEIVVDTSFSVEDELEESSNDGFDEFKWRWEVLSPEGSFVLYAASGQDRAEWTTLIRQAKSQHLISLHAQHPDSTLTSSEATKHIRRALQALPFAPNDIRMQGYQVDKRLSRFSVDSGKGESVDSNNEGSGNGKEKDNATKKHKKLGSKDKNSKPDWYKERRSKVEHWIPAIWIPDEKAEGCMRCGRAFGWRRRRHHCRLCGRCVCSSCSDKTFYITDPNSKDESTFSKAARACNACYESVFPLIDPHSDPEEEADESTVRARSYPPPLPHSSASEPTSSSFLPSSTSGLTYASNADTITSLSNLPSWMNMSVPSLALSSSSSNLVGARNKSKGKELSGPEALMAIDSKRYSYGLDGRRKTSDMGSRLSRDSGVVFDLDSSVDDITLEDVVQPARSGSRIKLRSQSSSGSRPRSYYDLVEDFHSASGGETPQAQIRTQTTAPLEDMAESDEDAIARLAYADGEESSALSSSSVNSSRRHTTTINLSTSSSSVSLSISPPTSPGALNVKGKRLLSGTLIAERREDTVRRHKRFSIPAVALQTTSVVARTQSILPETSGVLKRDKSVAFAESSSPSGTGEDVKRHTGSKLGSLLPGMPGTRSKRFSLVSGGRPQTASSSSRRIGQNEGHKKQEGTDLGMGVAASKLNELLGRSKHKAPGG